MVFIARYPKDTKLIKKTRPKFTQDDWLKFVLNFSKNKLYQKHEKKRYSPFYSKFVNENLKFINFLKAPQESQHILKWSAMNLLKMINISDSCVGF